MNENEAEAVLKQKGDSLRRVPADENPILKEMDDRADVKVRCFQLCRLLSVARLLCRLVLYTVSVPLLYSIILFVWFVCLFVCSIRKVYPIIG